MRCGSVALLGALLGACQNGSSASETTPPVAASVAAALPAAAPSVAKPSVAKPSVTNVEPPPWAVRTTQAAGFPCDVDRVLADVCRRCHWDPLENDAPFAMKSWEGLQEKRDGKPIFVLMQQMVEADLMPPTDAPVKPRAEPLSAKQKSTLLAWLGQGATRASDTCSEQD